LEIGELFIMQERNLNENIAEIVKLFFEDYMSLRQIAARFNVSAVSIKKALNRHGHDTSKASLHFETTCAMCENKIVRIRCQIRNKGIGNFCDMVCYHVYLDSISIGKNLSRNGMRKGRVIVESILGTLPEGSIVHHIDGDEENNEVENLMLLASSTDHLMIHRGFGEPKILFDGRDYVKLPKYVKGIFKQLKNFEIYLGNGKINSKTP
jgi:predicted DNA-binding protein YlxM (UPF0122 family)